MTSQVRIIEGEPLRAKQVSHIHLQISCVAKNLNRAKCVFIMSYVLFAIPLFHFLNQLFELIMLGLYFGTSFGVRWRLVLLRLIL